MSKDGNEAGSRTLVRRMLTLLAALPPAVLIIFGAAVRAMAHDELLGSEPGSGARLDDPPSQVALTFSAPLDPRLCQLAVTDATGTSVASGAVSVSDRSITRAVVIRASGDYTIAYRVVSRDGHPVSGTVRFTVTAVTSAATSMASASEATAPPPRTAGETIDRPDRSDRGARWWALAAGAIVALTGAGWWFGRRLRPSRGGS